MGPFYSYFTVFYGLFLIVLSYVFATLPFRHIQLHYYNMEYKYTTDKDTKTIVPCASNVSGKTAVLKFKYVGRESESIAYGYHCPIPSCAKHRTVNGASFNSASNLKRHVRQQHKHYVLLFDIECNTCGRSFGRSVGTATAAQHFSKCKAVPKTKQISTAAKKKPGISAKPAPPLPKPRVPIPRRISSSSTESDEFRPQTKRASSRPIRSLT